MSGQTEPPGRVYSALVPGPTSSGSDRGGHAIARSGRVVRPVRRPTDRQTKRRNASGDPREICNQVPSRQARDFLILNTGRDRQTARAKMAVAL